MNSASVQVAGYVPGPATKIASNAGMTHGLGKPVEQSAIQRLVLQLIEHAPRVLDCDPVIAGLNVAGLLLKHLVLDHLVSLRRYYFRLLFVNACVAS
jgi:hypothetical protein